MWVETELYHHGIKGQKWGVRRFQNYDGSLTNAGMKRYNDSEKSKHRNNLEEKYKSKGMNQKEAEELAAKRIKAEKYVATAAGVTVAACAVYYTYRKVAVDKVISSNTDFQRIMRLNVGEQINPGRSYVAYKKNDKEIYKGKLGRTFIVKNTMQREKDIQNVKINFKEDIKLASPKRARTTFANMYKHNKEFRDAVNRSNTQMGQTSFEPHKKLYDAVRNNDRTTSKISLMRKGYDAFNVGLANNSESGKKAANMFYDEMRRQGVNAIRDINDVKYSGYRTSNPLIVFNGSFKYSGKKMTNAEINESLQKAANIIAKKELVESGSKFVAKATVTSGAAYGYYKGATTIAVDNYRKQNPNTNLTNKQIIDMLSKQKHVK